MRRRDFIAGLALPLLARPGLAQPQRVFRLAITLTTAPVSNGKPLVPLPFFPDVIAALNELGWVEGRNLAIEWWSAEGRTERFPEIAAAIARSAPDVVFGIAEFAPTLREEAKRIPVVTVTLDPVLSGLAASISRPEGNVTGIAVDVGPEGGGKRLELLKELLPEASRFAWLAPPLTLQVPIFARALDEAGRKAGVSLVPEFVESPRGEATYRLAIQRLRAAAVDAIIVGPHAPNMLNAALIVRLAAELRMPACFAFEGAVGIGGLCGYWTSHAAPVPRLAADYIDRILRGARPGELPFHQPTGFHVGVNLTTARSLGLGVPPALLARADEVVE